MTDVAGIDEAKDECEEIIAFLQATRRSSSGLGGGFPKGVLLDGFAPGTGKTLLARAIAGEAGVPFFSISGSDFVEMFVGVGASRVRDLFEQGKKNAPCIIFIDEIDAVGRQRGAGLGGGHDEREQTLNQLLVEMDGFESNEGVISLLRPTVPTCSTPLMLRPGRFDRRVVVPRPDVQRPRRRSSRSTPSKVPLSGQRRISRRSGARLSGFLRRRHRQPGQRERAAECAPRYRTEIGAHERLRGMAKDKVLMGTERRSMVVSDVERRRTAVHEAGHTVVGYLLPDHDPVHKVSIIPRGPALGVTMSLPKEDRLGYSKKWALARIAMALGGRIAEKLILDELTTGASDDFRQATEIARSMVTQWGMSETLGPLAYTERQDGILPFMPGPSKGNYSEHTARLIDQEVQSIVEGQYELTLKLLTEHQDKINAMADALLERETLGNPEITAVMEGTELPAQEIVVIPRYSDINKRPKDGRDSKDGKGSIFNPGPAKSRPAVRSLR